MGEGRHGGRANPHTYAQDVGRSYQGETIQKAFSTVPSHGAVGKEVDGEGLAAFKPKEGGSLNNQTKGEKRETPSKPPGDPKFANKPATPAIRDGSPAARGEDPQGEPGKGVKQTGSKGSDPPGIGRRGNATDGGPGSGPRPGGGKGPRAKSSKGDPEFSHYYHNVPEHHVAGLEKKHGERLVNLGSGSEHQDYGVRRK